MDKRSEILQIINTIAKNEIHDKSAFKELVSEENFVSEAGIDSFDFIMLYMKLGEIYKINSKLFKDYLGDGDPKVGLVIDLIEQHGTISGT